MSDKEPGWEDLVASPQRKDKHKYLHIFTYDKICDEDAVMFSDNHFPGGGIITIVTVVMGISNNEDYRECGSNYEIAKRLGVDNDFGDADEYLQHQETIRLDNISSIQSID